MFIVGLVILRGFVVGVMRTMICCSPAAIVTKVGFITVTKVQRMFVWVNGMGRGNKLGLEVQRMFWKALGLRFGNI